MLRSTWKNTWLVEDWPCILWGLVLRSINLVSVIPWPSMLLTSTGIGELLWFCWFSLVWKFGNWFWSLLTPFWTSCRNPGSFKWPGLSPGNYRRTSRREVLISVYKPDGKKKSEVSSTETQTWTLCLNRRYLLWVLLPPTCTIISHCRQRELPSTSQ